MRRREFITLLGGAAALSPFAAHAQQAERVRRVGILLTFSDEDPEAKAWLAAFRQGLERRGWREGRNLHIDIRSASARGERIPGLAKELSPCSPTCCSRSRRRPPAPCSGRPRRYRSFSSTSPTRSARGSSPAWPGRKPISPACCTTRRASSANGWPCSRRCRRDLRAFVLANSKTTAFDYFLRSAQGAAPSLGVEVIPTRIESAADIERAIEEFATRAR